MFCLETTNLRLNANVLLSFWYFFYQIQKFWFSPFSKISAKSKNRVYSWGGGGGHRIFRPKRKQSASAKKIFCTNFKTFCFNLYVFGLTRNVPLYMGQFPDQIKLFCFVPDFLAKRKRSALRRKFFAPIQNVLLRSICFLDQIETFHSASVKFWTKPNWFASSQKLWAKMEKICSW